MILEMKVPSPGESITEVEIAQWLVSNGDYVEKDQAIAEVDSDKATLELPAEVSGTITLKAEEGDAVDVGAVVCLIDTDGKNKKIEGQVESSEEILETEKVPIRHHQFLVIMQHKHLHLQQEKSWMKKALLQQILRALEEAVESLKMM